MRKLSPFLFFAIMISIMIILLTMAGISVYKEHRRSGESDIDALILDSNLTGLETMVYMETEEELLIEFLSVNYLEDKEYLMRASIDGEEVGKIYFDENGEIRFDGDREKFEDAIFKAFDLRRK